MPRSLAWACLVLVVTGLVVTPGVRHGDSPRRAAGIGEADPGRRSAESKSGVIVYRRERPERPFVPAKKEAIGVAHHEAEASGGEHFVHTHDGRNPHVHYSILGFEVTIPASPMEDSETLLASTSDDATGAETDEDADIPTLTRAPFRSAGELPAATTGYVAPAKVALPDPAPGHQLLAAVALPSSPLLEDDAPVPRRPRV